MCIFLKNKHFTTAKKKKRKKEISSNSITYNNTHGTLRKYMWYYELKLSNSNTQQK